MEIVLNEMLYDNVFDTATDSIWVESIGCSSFSIGDNDTDIMSLQKLGLSIRLKYNGTCHSPGNMIYTVFYEKPG